MTKAMAVMALSVSQKEASSEIDSAMTPLLKKLGSHPPI